MNITRLVDSFIEMVQINSETKNEFEMMQYVLKKLQEMGLETYMDDCGSKLGSNGNNVYCKIPGDESMSSILLSAHLDTVSPGNDIVPVINGDVISSSSNTILGGDDKAGIAVILEAIRTIKEENLIHRPIEIVFSIYEEGGLHGAKNVEIEKLRSKHALVFDSGGEIGKIINEAPGQDRIEICVQGLAAHAGLEPEKGINALVVASHAISNIKFGRLDEETTSNIGIVSGGVATNIVMPSVDIVAEVRSLDNDKLAFHSKLIQDEFIRTAKEFNTTVDVNIKHMYDSFKVDKDSSFIKQISNSFTALGIPTNIRSTGGGSDTNIYTAHGLCSLNLSVGMTKVHTVDEFIKISDMEQITNVLIHYLTN